jgi:hypothetical protein
MDEVLKFLAETSLLKCRGFTALSHFKRDVLAKPQQADGHLLIYRVITPLIKQVTR